MSFAWPHLLWLLLLPLGLFAWEITHRRRTAAQARPKILRAEAGPRSLRLAAPEALPAPAAARPRPWLCFGLCLALIALARPQWGRLEEPVFDQSREILLAVDLSRSMLTPDVKPSRLDRAKLLIQALLEKLQGERVGLVVFAGTAFLQSPLSADYEILREFLPALGPDFLPQGGSNYGALLDASLQAFSATNSADRFLVILSDGEATDDDWKSQVTKLKGKGIRVLGLGVGTAEGAMIPDGSGGLVKDERGAVVMSKLESATLQELARATDGVYRDASSWVDLAGLVRETIETGRRGEFVEKNTVRLVERFQWPLALAVWLLGVSLYYEFPVRPRTRDLRLAPARPTGTAVALLFLAGVALAPAPARAAVKLAPAPAGSTPAAAAPTADAAPLARIVGRVAGLESPTGRDWAELARETVSWGSRLKSGSQPVPEAPVRDALAAVRLGAKLDPNTADWPKLREELEALLEKPEEQKPEDQDQQQQPQDQSQKSDQQKQDQQKQKQQPQQNQKQEPQDQSQKDESSPQNEQNSDAQKQDQKPQPGESAFGDMNKKEPPPPPPEPQGPEENMQKVGGAEKPPEKEQADPSLALPLQKLDQLRNQDSPAQLFQLMEGEKKPAKKTSKDW